MRSIITACSLPMPRRITIRKPEGPIRCTIDLPRSKSIANRALILASLAGDLSCVRDLSEADDTRILHQLLREKPRVMHCGAGGTTFRFLLAWASVQQGEEHVLTGDQRLLERPHEDLINALRSLGASIQRTNEGYLVKGSRLPGGNITLDSPISSQFISALLMIAPRMEKGLELRWTGRRLSEPYVRMTVKCLQYFGAIVEEKDDVIHIDCSALTARELHIPRDWSAASFWFEIMLLAEDAQIDLPGLRRDNWQGDEVIVPMLSNWINAEIVSDGVQLRPYMPDILKMGPRRLDLSDTPDLFQPLAFAFAGLGYENTFYGLDNLAEKETDRIAAVAETLSMMEVKVFRNDNTLHIERKTKCFSVAWHVRGDHRMAMAMAPLALLCGSITLRDPDVVTKSYPAFWEDLRRAGFGVELS
jgi:3-phosphoshikimate 1-carboxyvinyltransferase